MASEVKVLLKESIRHVGRVGDIVDVSAGYARNYLIPNDLAVEPTPNNIKKIEARKKEIEEIERQKRAQQAELIKRLAGTELTLERRANEQGHLFGSVSATEIAKALDAAGFKVEADDVLLPGKLDRIEKYTVVVAFTEELRTDVKVWIAPDAESKELIEAARKAKASAETAAE